MSVSVKASSSEEDRVNASPKTQSELDKGAPKILGQQAIPGEMFTSGKICAQCKHCDNIGTTEVTSFWSVKSCLFCYYYGGYWACWQLLNGKDFIPKDAYHHCKGCKKEMYHYESCELVKVEIKAETK